MIIIDQTHQETKTIISRKIVAVISAMLSAVQALDHIHILYNTPVRYDWRRSTYHFFFFEKNNHYACFSNEKRKEKVR